MQRYTNSFYPRRDAETGLEEDRRHFLEAATVSLGLPSLFYASLRNARVFETVVGRPLASCEWERVAIRGFRLGAAAAGTEFPGIFPEAEPAGAELECIAVHDLTRFEQTMVAWYEWDEYLMRRIPLADGRTAQAFVPDPEAIRREHGRFEIRPWSYETWQSRGVDQAVDNARQWLAQRPRDADLARAGFFVPTDGRATG